MAEDARVELGRKLFFDTTLSEPAGTSCASCHDPQHGYAGNHGSNNGVAQGSRRGHYARRNTPSVLYLRFIRRPHIVWDDDGGDPELFGGFFWDGRAETIAAAVRQPLLHADEMGNRSVSAVARKVRNSSYAGQLQREFDHAYRSADDTLAAVSLCLEAFLISSTMAPFSSKYDDFVRGLAALTSQEQRGLALFQAVDKGACSTCHRMDSGSGLPESSLFSDFGYDAVAVPRNRAVPANHRAGTFDLGVCEQRHARLHTEDPWFCGAFRTPSLRNVALRERYMHNGVFESLHEVVSFYATRATAPRRWYARGELDDLPPRYHANVNTDAPPYNQVAGGTPSLSEAEIEDIVAFLRTLSDRTIPNRGGELSFAASAGSRDAAR